MYFRLTWLRMLGKPQHAPRAISYFRLTWLRMLGKPQHAPRAISYFKKMNQINQFFNEHTKAIAVDSRATASRLAYELQRNVFRQIRANFNNPSAAFSRGVKVHEFETASYVTLSPILSVHAEETKLRGSPNIWILLPDGQRLGFKRIGKGFSWSDLKRRFGTRLSFVSVDDGTVVLFRSDQGVKPIYKIQSQVTTKQRIEFYEKAEKIANERGLGVSPS